MTENDESSAPEKLRLPPPDLTPVRVKDLPPPPVEAMAEGPRDLTPISWGGTYDADADFRPMAVRPEEESAPKDLSAAESADFSEMPEGLIPTLEDLADSSQSDGLATSAAAARVSTPQQPPVPSKQTS